MQGALLLLFLSLLCSCCWHASFAAASLSSSAPSSSWSLIVERVWSELRVVLDSTSDLTFALLLLPFSVSAFPLAYLLLRKSAQPLQPKQPVSWEQGGDGEDAAAPPPLKSAASESSPSATDPVSIRHFVPAASAPPAGVSCSSSDFVIIGCGVAGATLSSCLSRRGYTVRCIERDLSEPHRIVGELLQPGGCHTLRALGLADCLQGYDEQQIGGYTILFGDQRPTVLSYPQQQRGRSFHHGRFVMALRQRAMQEPNCSLVQGEVTQLLEEAGEVLGVRYQTRAVTDSGQSAISVWEHRAALTVVADGCLSQFRGGLSSGGQSKLSSFLGLVLRDCPLPTAQHGHVILADPTPILAYPIGSSEVRMLVDLPNGLTALTGGKEAMRQHLHCSVRPQLPAAMRPSFDAAVSAGSWSSMPNQSLVCRPRPVRGALLLGDSGNMRHPLTGGGMTVAVKDCLSFMQALDHCGAVDLQAGCDRLQAAVSRHYAARAGHSAVINILADALYRVFSQRFASLRLACFRYLSEGDSYSQGPVRLLAGLSCSQLLLVYHFASVAVYGAWSAVWPWQGLSKVRECRSMLHDACCIIVPLLRAQNEDRRVASWALRAASKLLRLKE